MPRHRRLQGRAWRCGSTSSALATTAPDWTERRRRRLRRMGPAPTRASPGFIIKKRVVGPAGRRHLPRRRALPLAQRRRQASCADRAQGHRAVHPARHAPDLRRPRAVDRRRRRATTSSSTARSSRTPAPAPPVRSTSCSPSTASPSRAQRIGPLAPGAATPRDLPGAALRGRHDRALHRRRRRPRSPSPTRRTTRSSAAARRAPSAAAAAPLALEATMKTEIHPEYVESHVTLHLRQRLHDPLHRGRDPRRDLLELPPVLHGQAEARGHRRPRRPLPSPRRQARRRQPRADRRRGDRRAPPRTGRRRGARLRRRARRVGRHARRARRRPGRPRGRDDARRPHLGGRRAASPRPTSSTRRACGST